MTRTLEHPQQPKPKKREEKKKKKARNHQQASSSYKPSEMQSKLEKRKTLKFAKRMYNKLEEEEEDEQNVSRALGSYRYCDSTSMHMSKSFGGAHEQIFWGSSSGSSEISSCH